MFVKSSACAKEIAAIDSIDCLQLHGAESPEFRPSLIEAQITLRKPFPMIDRDIPLPDFHTNRLLLDTVAGTRFGGTGRPFPWNWARGLISANTGREFILAGGLNSENVAEAVNQTRPFGVDVEVVLRPHRAAKIFTECAILLPLRRSKNRLFHGRKQHYKAGLLPALTPLALTTIALLPCQLSLTN